MIESVRAVRDLAGDLAIIGRAIGATVARARGSRSSPGIPRCDAPGCRAPASRPCVCDPIYCDEHYGEAIA